MCAPICVQVRVEIRSYGNKTSVVPINNNKKKSIKSILFLETAFFNSPDY